MTRAVPVRTARHEGYLSGGASLRRRFRVSLTAGRATIAISSSHPPADRQRSSVSPPSCDAGQRVVLSTHMNADGDGCGSEQRWRGCWRQLGIDVAHRQSDAVARTFSISCSATTSIDQTREGLGGAARHRSADRARHQRREAAGRRSPRPCASSIVPKSRDRSSHRVRRAGWRRDVVRHDCLRDGRARLRSRVGRRAGDHAADRTALYAAILTDTGGFRFSNTTPRAHAIAGQLLAAGVDPEDMYRRIYASVAAGRDCACSRDVLSTLEVDRDYGIAVALDARRRARPVRCAVRGSRRYRRARAFDRRARDMALFFRDLGYGKVKVSFRSTGE